MGGPQLFAMVPPAPVLPSLTKDRKSQALGVVQMNIHWQKSQSRLIECSIVVFKFSSAGWGSIEICVNLRPFLFLCAAVFHMLSHLDLLTIII
jgi:hypothetical protein